MVSSRVATKMLSMCHSTIKAACTAPCCIYACTPAHACFCVHDARPCAADSHRAQWQAECIQHGLRTIAFCKTRKLCELVTAYTRETLKTTAPHLSQSISVYRAGYSPQASPPLYALPPSMICQCLAA